MRTRDTAGDFPTLLATTTLAYTKEPTTKFGRFFLVAPSNACRKYNKNYLTFTLRISGILLTKKGSKARCGPPISAR